MTDISTLTKFRAERRRCACLTIAMLSCRTQTAGQNLGTNDD